MEADRSLMKLPPLVHNPGGLSAIVKKKTVEKGRVKSRPPVAPEPQLLPIDWQLSKEHLDALREEISAAEPVLHNIYEDMDLFGTRDTGLNSIAFALFHMRDALEKYPIFENRKKTVKADIDYLIQEIELVVAQSRHHSIPLLEPMNKLSPLPGKNASVQANLADIVFIVSRSSAMRRDVKLLAAHIPDFYNELRNFGMEIRLGLMSYARTAQPAGPMRSTPEEFLEDLYAMNFTAESGNSLGAIQSALDDFLLRPGAGRHFIMLSDSDAHDDFGDMRHQTAERLSSEKVIFHALSVRDHFTRAPLAVYDSLAGSTGGSYYNIDQTEYRLTLSALAQKIAHLAVEAGATVVSSNDRTIPVGPSNYDFISVRFPDFRPAALGIVNLKLDTEDDFQIAFRIVENALSEISMDKVEKRVLQEHLVRILNHFDESRGYRLDFNI